MREDPALMYTIIVGGTIMILYYGIFFLVTYYQIKKVQKKNKEAWNKMKNPLPPPIKKSNIMSQSISIKAYEDVNNEEYGKHYEIVAFCINKGVSFPIETQDFFKGKIAGGNLNDYNRGKLLQLLYDGIEVPRSSFVWSNEPGVYTIDVSKIPKSVNVIKVKLE